MWYIAVKINKENINKNHQMQKIYNIYFRSEQYDDPRYKKSIHRSGKIAATHKPRGYLIKLIKLYHFAKFLTYSYFLLYLCLPFSSIKVLNIST